MCKAVCQRVRREVLNLSYSPHVSASFQGAGSNRLHKYISLWPIMKLWLVIFNTAYWGYISERVCAPSSVSSSQFATPSAMASSTRLTRLVSHTSGSHDLGH